ncbi:hypothetical protein FB451DRAFT_165717 [Mycena latifolia]|nr:hypothetical protein FB451DRAFT_165717 [Mycena latifolia]
MREFLSLFAVSVLSSQVVHASPGLAETLIGDKDPSVRYSGATSTLTRDNITIPFNGNSVWVSLRVLGGGECTISIDGTTVGSINSTSPDLVQGSAPGVPTPYYNTSLSNGGHTLLLSPGQDTQIEFIEAIIGCVDSIYICRSDTDVKANSRFITDPSAGHVNVRAIVGGVLGPVLFIAFLILGFYFFRRRPSMAKLVSSRGLPQGDSLEPGAKKGLMK